jgi:hypothetical protein
MFFNRVSKKAMQRLRNGTALTVLGGGAFQFSSFFTAPQPAYCAAKTDWSEVRKRVVDLMEEDDFDDGSWGGLYFYKFLID